MSVRRSCNVGEAEHEDREQTGERKMAEGRLGFFIDEDLPPAIAKMLRSRLEPKGEILWQRSYGALVLPGIIDLCYKDTSSFYRI